MSRLSEPGAVGDGAHPALRFDAPPRATLAAIQLPTDLTLEEEGPALLSRFPGVRLRLQKLALSGERLDRETYASGRGQIESAAAVLRPRGSLDAIGLACTSLAFTLGPEAVQDELRRAHPGAQATDMASAVLAALDALAIRRPVLLTPYLDDLHAANLELFASREREVVAHRNLGLETDERITSLSEDSLIDCVRRLDRPGADGVMIGCSAFRTLRPGLLDALEAELGKPVVTSQQALLWRLLRLAGVADRVAGFGSLLSER